MYAHCCIVLYMLPVNKHTHTHTYIYISWTSMKIWQDMGNTGEKKEQNRRWESHVSKFWRAQNPARQGALQGTQFISVCRFMAPKMVFFSTPELNLRLRFIGGICVFSMRSDPPFFGLFYHHLWLICGVEHLVTGYHVSGKTNPV